VRPGRVVEGLGLLGHRLYFSGNPALRRSSRKALFIGSLIARQDSVAIEKAAPLQPIGDDGAGLLNAAEADIDGCRHIGLDHLVTPNVF
jgi:hypothetical protein